MYTHIYRYEHTFSFIHDRQVLNKVSPESFWDRFDLRCAHSKYATRNCYDLQISKLKTRLMKRWFQ